MVAPSLKCCDFCRRSDNQSSRLTYAFFRQLNNPAAVSDLFFYFPARRVVHLANLAVHAFSASLFLGGSLRHTIGPFKAFLALVLLGTVCQVADRADRSPPDPDHPRPMRRLQP